MSVQPVEPTALTALAGSLDTLGPAFQALSLAAASVTAQQLAQQADKALSKQNEVIALTFALLLLLLLLAGLLFKQYQTQKKSASRCWP
ncbi:MAG: hypothetical protein EBQ71_15525 [Betaproteobacteria bacterium]|nr:hypothetical protein [Betaproteobacteria bacterium]